MRGLKDISVAGIVVLLIVVVSMVFGDQRPNNDLQKPVFTGPTQSAYFAGGCFWCMEGIFESQDGVVESIVGYIGWPEETATYAGSSAPDTLHREWVQVIYNPKVIDYETLVELFWTQIDPTDPGWQFADRGFQYTTAIYYDGSEEKQIAEASKKSLEDSGKFTSAIATKIIPLTPFYIAEQYHQDYYKKSPTRYKTYARLSGRKWFIEENWKERIAEVTESVYGDDSLRERLTPIQYYVTQQEGTEPPFQNEYWNNTKAWIYVDVVDGTPLYSSLDKFDSKTGWPSFTKTIDQGVVTEHRDNKLFIPRIEARSASSDAHLGHIFPDGPKEFWGLRHCINSAALRFIPVDKLQEEGYEEYIESFQ